MPILRREGRAVKAKETAKGIQGSTPNLSHVYAAVHEGHVKPEEAIDLNSKFKPEKQYEMGPYAATGKSRQLTQGTAYRSYQRGVAALIPNAKHVRKSVNQGHITSDEASVLNPNYLNNPVKRGPIDKVAQINRVSKVPYVRDIHAAVIGGHINSEEGLDLNKNYDPQNPRQFRAAKAQIKNEENKRQGKAPRLSDVHQAITGGNINLEEGQNLAPKYDPNNKNQQLGIQQTLSGIAKQRNRARRAAGYRSPKEKIEAGIPARKRVKNRRIAKTT
jgi:hypothetical protein